MRVEKRQKDRLLHQIMDEFYGSVQGFGKRRVRKIGVSKDVIADLAGDVDLSWRSGQNVGGQQSLPEHTQMLAAGAVGDDGRFIQLAAQGIVCFPVPLGLQREFQGLQTVVLREIGHKGTKGVWGRCSVGQHLI